MKPASGLTHRRGYGANHKRKRKRLAPLVARGLMHCARCGERIKPGEPWDLSHADHPQAKALGIYQGPEHRRCSRATAGPNAQTRKPTARALEFFNTKT